MVEELTIQSHLQVEFARRESEAFADHRARLLGTDARRSILHLIAQSFKYLIFIALSVYLKVKEIF